jgi:hypothetical protein
MVVRIVHVVVLLSVAQACLGQENGQPLFNPKTVLRNPIRPIVDAPFVRGKDATDEFVTDSELVLGVVVNGEPRAYPINMITGPRREIVNDRLGGIPIAATW